MTFDTLQQGDRVFVDANIFVYHCNGTSSECKQFLLRCSRKEIQGVTSTSVIAEVLHRLMIAEAVRKGYVSQKNPVKKLKSHPEIIKTLSDYVQDVKNLYDMNLTILPLTPECIDESADIRRKEGLLTNDSLIVTTMKNAGITKLATNDNDFDHISWLEIYKPADVSIS